VAYSKEEIKSFEAKDLRISKLAIIKSLIEKLDVEVVNEVNEIICLADKYIDYVYSEKKEIKVNLEDEKEVEISWVQIAEGLNLAIPNAINIKMLDAVSDEYNKAHKASINPSELLSYIMTKFGRYPSKQQNVDKVLESYSKNVKTIH